MRNKTISRVLFTLVIAGASLLSMKTCAAGPKVTVGARVPANQQVSMDQIDPLPWDALLKRYVDQNGRFWKQSSGSASHDRSVPAIT